MRHALFRTFFSAENIGYASGDCDPAAISDSVFCAFRDALVECRTSEVESLRDILQPSDRRSPRTPDTQSGASAAQVRAGDGSDVLSLGRSRAGFRLDDRSLDSRIISCDRDCLTTLREPLPGFVCLPSASRKDFFRQSHSSVESFSKVILQLNCCACLSYLQIELNCRVVDVSSPSCEPSISAAYN